MGLQLRNYRFSLQTSFTMTLQVDAKQAASKSQVFTSIVICNLLALYWQLKPNCCDTAIRDCFSGVRKVILIPMSPKDCFLEIN